jgi:hypothetical protein
VVFESRKNAPAKIPCKILSEKGDFLLAGRAWSAKTFNCPIASGESRLVPMTRATRISGLFIVVGGGNEQFLPGDDFL